MNSVIMSSAWQDFAAWAAVAFAAAWLVRRAWRLFARRTGCGGCGSCAEPARGGKPVVTTIGPLKANSAPDAGGPAV